MAEAGSGEKLKVFVSYSRRDSSDFAEELVAGLELAGFAPFLDRHDIAAGEDWEIRLGGLIQQADTIIFVVSPEAIKSERCVWEIDKAFAESKRVLPLIFKPVPDFDIPKQLQRLQFIRFDTGFARPLRQLAEALRQDVDWIREHTRLGEFARRWEARARSESLLLRGDDLLAAQAWVEQRKPEDPEISELIRRFIGKSKETEAAHFAKSNAAQRRIIRMQALASASLIVVIVGLIGWINQSYLKEKWRWYTITRPYMVAQVRPHVLTVDAEEKLQPGDSFKECEDCPEMMVVPAGSFTMGSPTSEKNRSRWEGPQHVVSISEPFAVARYPMTFAMWDTCASFGSCDPDITDSGFGRGQQPVINVTWYDAQRYAAWLSQMTGKPYRLLSEAEYEYATRAGTQTVFPWGDDIGSNNANCDGCGSAWDNRQPAGVGSFPPNQFGLFDMVGNVWKWVEDCWHSSFDGAPADGSPWIKDGSCSYRVDRGAGWSGSPEIPRSALRDRDTISTRGPNIGFRLARTLKTRP